MYHKVTKEFLLLHNDDKVLKCYDNAINSTYNLSELKKKEKLWIKH